MSPLRELVAAPLGSDLRSSGWPCVPLRGLSGRLLLREDESLRDFLPCVTGVDRLVDLLRDLLRDLV